MSAEHYVSRTVLEQMGDPVGVNGMPWLETDQSKPIGINALTAKILCSRHNSALSPLDSVAGAFMKAMQNIDSDYQRKSLSYKRNFIIFSGQALELWALKLLCGLYYSKNAAAGRKRLAETHTIEEQAVIDALYSYKWKDRCGLYIKHQDGHRELNPDIIVFAPLTQEERLTGISFAMMGFAFALLLDNTPQGASQQMEEGWRFRPSELCFEIQTRATSIALTWRPGTPPNRIKVSMLSRRR